MPREDVKEKVGSSQMSQVVLQLPKLVSNCRISFASLATHIAANELPN